MSEPITIDDSNFDQTVLQSDKPVLVDFWAPWCRPCQMIAPILDELAKDYSGKISITRMDVDQNPKTAAKYNIMSIPTLLLFKNGEPISHLVGLRPKEEMKRSMDEALG
ncbi:thioredoxin [Chloroflexota bacterium]